MDATPATATAPASSFWGDVGDFFSGALTTAENAYNKYLGFELYKAQAQAAAATGQSPLYQPTATTIPNTTGGAVYTPTTGTVIPTATATGGPFAGVSTQTMVLIAGAAMAALILLRK